MGLYPVAVCYNAIQDNTIQNSTIQCNTIQYSTIQCNNTHHTKSKTQLKANLYTLNYLKKYQEQTLCTIKTQKRVEPKVDESVLNTTRYTKQSANHTTIYSTLFHTVHTDLHLTTTSLSLYTLHIPTCLNSLPFTTFSCLHSTSNSLHFTSFHFTYHFQSLVLGNI